MSDLRRRKFVGTPSRKSKQNAGVTSPRVNKDEPKEFSRMSAASLILGATIAFVVGLKYATYIHELHENDMWFSNIGVSTVSPPPGGGVNILE